MNDLINLIFNNFIFVRSQNCNCNLSKFVLNYSLKMLLLKIQLKYLNYDMTF